MQTIEEKRAYNRERYRKRRTQHIAKAMEWASNNKNRVRNSYLLRNYGITLLEYEKMCALQGYRCAICGNMEDKLLVDHAHVDGYENLPQKEKSRYVRGLLCSMCNLGISYFDDSSDRLEIAKRYILSSEVTIYGRQEIP